MEVTCPYCNQPAKLIDSGVLYGRSYGMIWLCAPCDAYVGCHKGSDNHVPLGSLANAELRQYRKLAHAAFDPLWEGGDSRHLSRRAAYEWLANKLGLTVADCHISWFGVEECKRVIEVSLPKAMKGEIFNG